MTTREEFRGLVDALTDAAGGYECMYVEKHERDAAQNAVVAAWDAQAAELQTARAEVARVKDAHDKDGRLLAFASMDLKTLRAEVEALKAAAPQVPGAVPQPAPTTSRASRDVLPVAVKYARYVQRAGLFNSFGGTEELLEDMASALEACGVTDIAAALEARAAAGLKKYGRPLQTHNGRSAREDLAQELLDAWMYAVQDEMEAQDADLAAGVP